MIVKLAFRLGRALLAGAVAFGVILVIQALLGMGVEAVLGTDVITSLTFQYGHILSFGGFAYYGFKWF